MPLPHKFLPLRIASGPAANSLYVVCYVTKNRLKWSDAVAAGWCYDVNGPAFRAYYSPEGMKEVAARLSAKPIAPN